MPRKKRRTFTPEQRREAVRVLEQSGSTITAVAQDIGVSPSVLGRWSRKYGSGERRGAASTSPPDQEAELQQLRRENKVLRQERDFLKKSVAFFVRENS